MGKYKGITFEENIKRQVGEFIEVLIKSNKSSSRYIGVLSNVKKDYLILVRESSKVEIPLAGVMAIKKQAKGIKKKRDDDCLVEYHKQ